ncbi:hypothetical protein BDV32DRAFT_153543 [Aspergillus pseudonomiae]|nr:hypothetical protein BDV32DRAFT_153543 [Aspergillus pseudonomiae]
MVIAAFAFPDNVRTSPPRTTLRSYQLLSNKGSALDWENAGVYTNSMPESYLKYKSIWRTIQSMSEDLAKESKSLQKRSNAASISAFIKATVEEVKGLTKDNNEKKLMDALPQTAYDATITSLERARRRSRLQMIRIVQEVDAVSNGPSVAIGPDRVGRFLSPVLFQQLLPTVEPVVTGEDFEKWKYKHKELQKRVNNLEESTKELKETTEGHSKSIDVLKLKMNFISHNEVDD